MECGGELIEQQLRSRVAMRLENHMHLAETALPCRRQRCADLRGMMSVIVDHRHAIRGADLLKAAVHAVEVLQRAANVLDGHIESDPNGDRGCGVLDVVLAGNTELEFSQIVSSIANPKAAQRRTILARSAMYARHVKVGPLACSVGQDAPLNSRQQ